MILKNLVKLLIVHCFTFLVLALHFFPSFAPSVLCIIIANASNWLASRIGLYILHVTM